MKKETTKISHDGHRGRLLNLVYNVGLENVSEIQATEFFLTYIFPRGDVNPLAHVLLKQFGNFANIVDADISELLKIKGINEKSAYDVINGYTEEELKRVFRDYGEMSNARKMASIIVKERNRRKIETSRELENIVFHNTDKSQRYGKIHPATLVFQAIRIEVNDELNILKKSILNIPSILKQNGVVVIMSYHSLEDRIIKKFFKENEKTKNKDGIFKLLNNKVKLPTNEEIKSNPASRSAKMRIAQKV